MKLEVAFDDVSIEQCLSIVEKCHEEIDIIEVGTLFVIKEGLHPLRLLREKYPNACLLVDPKIMDAPEKIASQCFDAGADIVTVMAVAGMKVVERVIDVAKKYQKEVMVDLLGSKQPLEDAIYLDQLGAHYICVHSSTVSDESPLKDFIEIKKNTHSAKLAIAGGINENTIQMFVSENPDVIIVGSGVYNSKEPEKVVHKLKEKMYGI